MTLKEKEERMGEDRKILQERLYINTQKKEEENTRHIHVFHSTCFRIARLLFRRKKRNNNNKKVFSNAFPSIFEAEGRAIREADAQPIPNAPPRKVQSLQKQYHLPLLLARVRRREREREKNTQGS